MKIITFGEVMLRLAPAGYGRIVQTDSFNVTLAGAEANVAVDLANMGMDTVYVTKLPENEVGQLVVNGIRKYGVDTSMIVRGGERTGTFYLEKGASQRGSKVIYDRKYSAIAMADGSEFDWERIFSGADWFHLSGITPALGENVAQICIDACKEAKKQGVKISCDLNYRKNLWDRDTCNRVMKEICKYVDVCIANEEDAYDVFGVSADDSDIEGGVLSAVGYKKVADRLMDMFPFEKVAITLRESISASVNNWSAVLCDKDAMYSSRKYTINIVDRVGGGDSFAAGLIYSLTNGYDNQKAIEFATAASCLKHTIEGDFNLISVKEAEDLMNGSGNGRVKR